MTDEVVQYVIDSIRGAVVSAFESTVSKIRGDRINSFPPSAPVYISRAPGRLDLMGGNVDYTGGLVFREHHSRSNLGCGATAERSARSFSGIHR